MIPLCDVRLSPTLADAISDDIRQMLLDGNLVGGQVVERFESKWAVYCGRRFCVGISSGTDALRIALLAVGVKPGSEVIVPALTFAATWEAVAHIGATPVPVDVLPCATIDPEGIAEALTAKTAAIVPVHLYGKRADIGDEWSVPVVDDACQAHGLRNVAETAVYSFYPSKNLGAAGDAGALVTDDAHVASVARRLRQHGESERYHHTEVGYTARLDAVQAAVLLRKLPLLDEWNRLRADAARFYDHNLDGVGDIVLQPSDTHYVYSVRTADPDGLAAHLYVRGIQTGRHYPVALHLSRAFAHLGYQPGAFAVAEQIASECISLPLSPSITPTQQEYVVDAVKEWF